MTDEVTQFDPIKYKETTREQWQTAAEPWYRWGPTIEERLGQATETMLDMAEVGSGRRVLDVAAGAGGRRSQQQGASDQPAIYWPPISPPTFSNSPRKPPGRRASWAKSRRA